MITAARALLESPLVQFVIVAGVAAVWFVARSERSPR